MPADAREQAFVLLLENREKGTFSSRLLQEAYDRFAAEDAAQRSFFKYLTESVLEHRILADEIIRRVSTRPPEKLKPKIRVILEMGICQILFMDAVPDHAAVNESVQLARRKGCAALTGFVNGVLRRVIRERDDGSLLRWMNGLAPSLRFSVPEWLCEMWEARYGREETLRLLAAFDEKSPVTVRLDERMGADEMRALTERMRAKGAQVEAGRILSYARRLTDPGDPRRLPGYAEGSFYIQDESAMLAVEAAEISPGDRILDLCAAPGGKATHAAIKTGPGGHVTACDLREEKLPRIRENAERLSLDNLTVRQQDAAVHAAQFEAAFDIVLCDLPCSGLGIIGRKHDIRYRVCPGDIPALASLQRQILENAAAYVRPGGQLIYSTCTITAPENEENADYIAKELGLTPIALPPVFAPILQAGAAEDDHPSHRIQLLPHVHGTDGFFIARFRRPLQGEKP